MGLLLNLDTPITHMTNELIANLHAHPLGFEPTTSPSIPSL